MTPMKYLKQFEDTRIVPPEWIDSLGGIRDELSIRDGMKTYSYSLVYKGSKYQKSSLFKWEKCDKTFSGKTPLKKT